MRYYPFGLTMAGISSKALSFGEPENKKKYNGIEKIGDFGLEDFDAQFRELDPQIGRWWEVDPKTENQESMSPYASMSANPISQSDPLGDEDEDCCKEVFNQIVGGVAIFENKGSAMQRESQLKTWKNRARIQELIARSSIE